MKKMLFVLLILLSSISLAKVVFAYDLKPYFVLYKFDGDLLLYDDYNFYLVDYGLSCSSFDFTIGDIIYIDSYISPSILDDIYVESFGESKTCSVYSSDQLNLVDYYVELVNDSDDTVLLQDKQGDRYLVEYGTGCLSMWRYEGEYIQIDISGSFLDGISDKIYLFENDDQCKVWDAEEFNLDFESELNVCPDMVNGYLATDGNCYCNLGYAWSELIGQCVVPVEVTSDTTSDVSDSVEASPFNDITSSHKNFDAIFYLYNSGIINGYPDGTFKPTNTVNRAELLKILVEGKGISPSASTYSNCFSDVRSDWYAPYVCYAEAEGWVDGYLDGTFKPAQTVNKAEALKILLNSQAIITPLTVLSEPYDDVSVTDWFAPFVSKSKELGILEETGSIFNPSAGMKRAGISENLYRLLTL